jgi:PAS domain S-box-containing protein
MKRNVVLAILAVLVLGIVTLLILHLHYASIEEVLSQFQERQLSYAKHLSNQIQFYIQARSRGMKALSSFASLQYGEATQLKLDIDAYAKEIGQVYVKAISLYNGTGALLYSTRPVAVASKKERERLFVWAAKKENEGKFLLLPSFPESQLLTFVLATPLYQEVLNSRYPSPSGKFVGIVTFTLDMKKFLADQLVYADPKRTLNEVWIMGKDGTLLFQPDHPEMLFRNIFQREGNCQSCHLTFSYAEEILRRKQGTFDYRIKSHPQKIAAFASMEFENVSWVVVVNTPYDRVTGFVERSLREHLILIGIVALAFATGSILVIRNERKKIKAEEEVVRWQETMAERKKAEEALELERNKLKGILDSMSDGVYIVNQQYEVLYTNPLIETAYGAVSGRKCHDYLHDLPEPCSWCKMEEVFAGNQVRWEWQSPGTGRTYDLFDTPIPGPSGAPCKLQFIRDVSDWKRAERELRRSEKRYRLLVETMSDGLGVQDEHGLWTYVNDRFCEMLGYLKEEMTGRSVTDFLQEADQAIYKEQVSKRRKGEVASYELSWLKKGGESICTLVSPKPIFNGRGEFKGSFAVVTGITERKQAEEALKASEKQLRFLSSQLLTAQETERKRISRELHDELGQSLTVMKLRLNYIEKNLNAEQAELRQECEYGVQYIDQVIENIRRLSRDLSPTILEDFGLSAALRWLINNFARSYTIKVVLNMIDVDTLLPRDAHVVVYRTVQEALTNVGRHSRAGKVSISIREEIGAVRFSIEDDGTGFDARVTEAKGPEGGGLGLATMRGRVQMVGGVLSTWSEEGKGTRITLSIPIERGGTPA